MFFASYMGLSCFGVFCIGVDFSECAVEASRIYIPEYGKTFHLPDYSYDKAGNQEKQYFISRCFAGRSAERYIFI